MNEVEALSILTGTPTLGTVKIRQLIQFFGSAIATLNAEPADVVTLPGFGSKIAEQWGWWKKNDSWERNLEIAERYQVRLVSYTCPEYPKELLKIPDYPVLLYIMGGLKKSDERSLAIVGTRNATIYGREQAERFGEALAGSGFTIVSGLARGIDTAAHKAALTRGRTVAVIGSGLANLYPAENKELAKRICEQGALISEYSMNAPPDRQHFPRRNRIVSGMSLGTLLIEAPVHSGAMLTMSNAKDQNKYLWAIPGRCDYESFKGNHQLIRQGAAQLVDTPGDIEATFDDLFPVQPLMAKVEKKNPVLGSEEINFLQTIPDQELHIDRMIQLTKLPINKFNVLLMGLVMKQVIKEYPGKMYKKNLITDYIPGTKG